MQTYTVSSNVLTASVDGFYVFRLNAPTVGSGGTLVIPPTNPALANQESAYRTIIASVYNSEPGDSRDRERSAVVWLTAGETVRVQLFAVGGGHLLQVSGARFAQDELV